jgi:hypothetical protein
MAAVQNNIQQIARLGPTMDTADEPVKDQASSLVAIDLKRSNNGRMARRAILSVGLVWIALHNFSAFAYTDTS